MPDTLNKQALINLLIDSPLREPIKINLVDIVNNTSEPDLPKVYSTITKELEIFQKATERRMKLADETIAKLSGNAPVQSTAPASPAPVADPTLPTPPAPADVPPLDLPPLPQPVSVPPEPVAAPPMVESPVAMPPLSVPPLDLPPLPGTPAPEPAMPAPQPLGTPAMASSSDEDALAEIQKELDSLKSTTASDLSADTAGVPPATAPSPDTAPVTPAPQS